MALRSARSASSPHLHLRPCPYLRLLFRLPLCCLHRQRAPWAPPLARPSVPGSSLPDTPGTGAPSRAPVPPPLRTAPLPVPALTHAPCISYPEENSIKEFLQLSRRAAASPAQTDQQRTGGVRKVWIYSVHALRILVRRTLASVQPLLFPSPRRSCRRSSRVCSPSPWPGASSSSGLTVKHGTQLHIQH